MLSKSSLRGVLFLVAITCTFAWSAVIAAPTNSYEPVIVSHSLKHDTSAPLREIAKDLPPPTPRPPMVIPNHLVPEALENVAPRPNELDPLLQNNQSPQSRAPAPFVSFEGTSDDDNAAVVGFRLAPPDTEGDVGPNHYVQWNNLIIEIFDKAGTSLLGPIPGNAIFTGFGGVCESTNNGDPIVRYDQFADRWMISQFAINDGVQCVAVSQTADPTGAYHRYAFPVTSGANDYPKLGVWPDAYYMTFNNFEPGFTGAFACAMERDQMLIGGTADFVCFVVPPAGNGDTFFSLLPATVEGLTAPPAGTPNPFIMAFDDEIWGGTPVAGTDSYKVWEFTVDWANPANSTFTGPTTVPTAEFDGNFCGFSDCIPQADTATLLDTLGQFTMFAAIYRNWESDDGHPDGVFDALWVNHSTDVNGADLAGVRWAELRDPTGTPVVHQAGTFAPLDGLNRWMPSLSVDNSGNMLIGYSTSSSTTFPSIAWAGRLVTDPLGQLSQGETQVLAGTGSQTAPGRWGDYASMSLDESDGCGFWFTTEYYQTTGSFDWNTRIAATSYLTCTAAEVGTIAGTVTNADTSAPIEGALVTADDGAGGTFSSATDASGQYTILAPAGTYDVTAEAFGFAPETVTGVVVTDQTETVVDFALTPVPAVTVDGFVTDGSGAGWPLYASVTVELDAGGGTPVTVFTDPDNGYYVVEGLFAGEDYNFHVAAITPSGYVPEDRLVATGMGDSQENFALQVGGSCSVPGYEVETGATLVSEDFEGATFPPTGWTNPDSSTCAAGVPTGWNNQDTGGRGNMTGGSGLFAIVDSDECGFGNTMNADLITPEFDLSASSDDAITVAWNHDYRDLGSTAQVQAWDGSAWVTIADFSGTSDRGPVRREANTTIGIGLADAKYRWHYASGWDWWWEVDDVEIVTSSCVFQGGGLFVGNVSDGNTGEGIVGADVSLDTGQSTTTVATPDDQNLADGFYSLFAPLQPTSAPGVRTITVASDGYGTAVRDSVVTPNSVKREDFVLAAGQLSATPQELRQRVAIGGTGEETLTLVNSGGLDAAFDVVEINFPAPPPEPAGGWPTSRGVSPLQPDVSKQDYLTSVQLTAEGVPNIVNHPIPPVSAEPTMKAAGDFVDSHPTNLTFGWGNGWDYGANTQWISNLAAAGGDDLCYEFAPDGTQTGDTIDCNYGGTFPADLAYNTTTDTLWEVNVGGDNCLHEIDPVTLTQTGNTICGPWPISQRGVAYNEPADTYFVGGWNDETLYEINPDGSLVRSVAKPGLNISGLAYNATTQHLFVQVNDGTQLVHVFDVTDPSFAEIGTIELLDSGGSPAYAGFEGAGLTFDCSGNLVSVNQVTQTVFFNDPGESGIFCEIDIPWFDPVPSDGTVLANGSTDVVGGFNALNFPPSCPEAHVQVTSDTPYDDIIVPVGMTVEFNDVSEANPFDPFIHGLANAQIGLGCGQGNFCPDDPLLRNVMALWLVRAGYGIDFAPPPATGLVFDDVAPNDFAADEIEFIAAEEITQGCSVNPPLYCPEDSVTRAQMAVFLLRTLEGGDYTPPACTGVFNDVPCSNPFAAWIEDLFNRGITSGCATDPLRYCPNQAIPRGQMAVFVLRTFDIPMCLQ